VGGVPFAFSPAKGTVRSSLFAYDGDNLIEETNSSGTAVARYSQGLNIDEPLAMERSSATSFYDADGLGSITSLSNSAGALAETYTRDSFGEHTGSTGSLTNWFQYTGREFDTETSLYYYRARYYDPQLGRFLSEDPWHFEGGIDFYRSASNNVTVFADPFGNQDCESGVKCRGVRDRKLGFLKVLTLGLVRYVHCYVFFTDSTGKTTIISAGPRDRTKMDEFTRDLDKSSEKNNFGKDKELAPTCKDAPTGDCSKGDCLKNVANGYTGKFPDYDYKGEGAPNSNSFADYVTHACGLDFNFPKNAKGWDYHRKNPQSP
jgi:RHS repeat-associated protein